MKFPWRTATCTLMTILVAMPAYAEDSVFFRLPAPVKESAARAFIANSPVFVEGIASQSVAVGVAGLEGSVSYSMAAGVLPEGLVLNRNTGSIVGRPGSAGAVSGLVVKAKTEGGQTVETAPFSLRVLGGDDIWVEDVGNLTLQSGELANIDLEHSPRSSVTWELAKGSGALPPGLSVAKSGVTLSGSPTTTGRWDGIILEMVTSGGRKQTNSFSITVVHASPINIVAAEIPAEVSLSHSVRITLPESAVVRSASFAIDHREGRGAGLYAIQFSENGQTWGSALTFSVADRSRRVDRYAFQTPIVGKFFRLVALSDHPSIVTEFSLN